MVSSKLLVKLSDVYAENTSKLHRKEVQHKRRIRETSM